MIRRYSTITSTNRNLMCKNGHMAVNRKALLARHHPHVSGLLPRSPLQVGNGQFAMSVDVTGLQTFPRSYPGPDGGTLLGTMAHWGWHSMPNLSGFQIGDCLHSYDTVRGPASYMDLGHEMWGADAAASEGTPGEVYFRANPQRIDLGRISLILPEETTLADVGEVDQNLMLEWGLLVSQFEVGRDFYLVQTCVDMESDSVAVAIETSAPRTGIRLSFPYASTKANNAQDWTRPGAHKTTLAQEEGGWRISRALDDTSYVVLIGTSGRVRMEGDHEVRIDLAGEKRHEVVIQFLPDTLAEWALPSGAGVRGLTATMAEIKNRTKRAWETYWNTGAIEMVQSDHPQALELERRVVLSRYLTWINSAGLLPVPETGLYTNSWRGKFHLEMQWWHLAHFALWGNAEIVECVLSWYDATLASARGIARRQGYPGARWLKSSGPEARETPSSISPFLIWQQPHPIYLAELVRRARPRASTMDRWWPMIRETAVFMAAYPVDSHDLSSWFAGRESGSGMGQNLDSRTTSPGGLVFPPPLIPAQECYASLKAQICDPTYELVYWVWGLMTAANWAEKMGEQGLAEQWRSVARHMRVPTPHMGVYPAIGIPPWTTRVDHPSMLAGLGFTPETGILDKHLMEATLLDVHREWEWGSTWGWDYPMMAMTAARVGRPDLAVQSLLVNEAKNTYLPNGHNWQTSELPAYLPGNGGLLAAVALMAAGWENGPARPGFDSRWKIEFEGIMPLP